MTTIAEALGNTYNYSGSEAMRPRGGTADATDLKSGSHTARNTSDDKQLAICDDRSESAFRAFSVACSACGASYHVGHETIRRADRFDRLCKKCRARKGQAAGMRRASTPESTKAERIRANGLVNSRKQSGWFKPPTNCMKCGVRKPRLDSHHPDYSKPDEVVWLCRSCHMRAHRQADFLAGVNPVRVTDQRFAPSPSALAAGQGGGE